MGSIGVALKTLPSNMFWVVYLSIVYLNKLCK